MHRLVRIARIVRVSPPLIVEIFGRSDLGGEAKEIIRSGDQSCPAFAHRIPVSSMFYACYTSLRDLIPDRSHSSDWCYMQVQRSSIVAVLLIGVSVALLSIAQSSGERVLALLSVVLLLLHRAEFVSFSRTLQSFKSALIALQQLVNENDSEIRSKIGKLEEAVESLQSSGKVLEPAPVLVQRSGASWRTVAGVGLALFAVQIVMLLAGLQYAGSIERGLKYLRSQVSEVSPVSAEIPPADTFQPVESLRTISSQSDQGHSGSDSAVLCLRNRCRPMEVQTRSLAAVVESQRSEARARLADAPVLEEAGVAHAAER